MTPQSTACESTLRDDVAMIKRLNQLGFTQRQIAKSLKLSLTFVSGVLLHDYGRYQPTTMPRTE